MTNITLSIDDDVYKKMKEYSEIKWSEFVRKSIQQRLKELESLTAQRQETLLAMLASQSVLKKDWENENDARWDRV